jgi:hypothetical protein
MNYIRQQQQFTPNYSTNKNQSQYPQYSNPNSIKNLKYDY